MKRSRATMDNNLKIVGPAMSDLPWKIVLPAQSVILPLLPPLPSCFPQSFRNHAGWEPLSGGHFGENHVNSSERPL